jgi:hypothetical protein
VAKGSIIYSDEHGSYRLLNRLGYDHMTTNHSRGQHVDGTNHVQNVENLWSGLKRALKATYYHVSPKHLQKYADEVAFRYSVRHLNNMERLEAWFAGLRPRRARKIPSLSEIDVY